MENNNETLRAWAEKNCPHLASEIDHTDPVQKFIITKIREAQDAWNSLENHYRSLLTTALPDSQTCWGLGDMVNSLREEGKCLEAKLDILNEIRIFIIDEKIKREKSENELN